MDLTSKSVLSPRQGSLGQVPTQHQRAAPLHRWTVDAGPKAMEEDLHHPGTVRPSPTGSGEGLEHHRLHEGSVHRKRRKSEKEFGAPTHPTAAQKPHDGRWEHFSRECQAVSKATPCSIPKESWRTASNCRKHGTVYGVLEFKPRLRGSLGHGPKPAEACCPTARGHQAKSLPSISMLPHCNDGPSTLGPKLIKEDLHLSLIHI